MRVNRHAQAAEHASLAWLQRLGIVTDARRLGALAQAHLTTLVAGFYPSAGLRELGLASDYVCWAFALDDLGDETEVGLRPARLAELFAVFEQLMNGATPGPRATPLDHGFHEILSRVAELTTPEQLAEFIAGNRAYFGGMLWEANNRAHGYVPDEAAYLALRPAAGAVPSFFALIEPLERIRLAPEVRAHHSVTRLTTLAGGIICWLNDLLSYEKERAHGDFHNLVMVYEHHRRLAPGTAAADAVGFINAAMRDFARLSASLPAFGAEQDRALLRYVEVLRSVVRVTLHWTYESSRYARS